MVINRKDNRKDIKHHFTRDELLKENKRLQRVDGMNTKKSNCLQGIIANLKQELKKEIEKNQVQTTEQVQKSKIESLNNQIVDHIENNKMLSTKLTEVQTLQKNTVFKRDQLEVKVNQLNVTLQKKTQAFFDKLQNLQSNFSHANNNNEDITSIKNSNHKTEQRLRQANEENKKLNLRIAQQQNAINNFTQNNRQAYDFIVKTLQMIGRTNNYSTSNCTSNFLSRHVPNNIPSCTPQSFIFNDLNDPILRAFREVSGMKTQFNDRLEKLFNIGWFGENQTNINSLIFGNFVADFHSTVSKSINVKFRVFQQNYLPKENGKFYHFCS